MQPRPFCWPLHQALSQGLELKRGPLARLGCGLRDFWQRLSLPHGQWHPNSRAGRAWVQCFAASMHWQSALVNLLAKTLPPSHPCHRIGTQQQRRRPWFPNFARCTGPSAGNPKPANGRQTGSPSNPKNIRSGQTSRPKYRCGNPKDWPHSPSRPIPCAVGALRHREWQASQARVAVPGLPQGTPRRLNSWQR